MNQLSPTFNTNGTNIVQMDFSSIMKEVSSGKKITKLEWQNESIYGFLKDNILTLHKEDNTEHNWIISLGDLTGEDWIVIVD